MWNAFLANVPDLTFRRNYILEATAKPVEVTEDFEENSSDSEEKEKEKKKEA